jgi:hypothetical protein
MVFLTDQQMTHVQLIDTYTGVCTCWYIVLKNLFAQALETHRKMRASRAFAIVFEESANNNFKNYINQSQNSSKIKSINHRNKMQN